MIHRNYYLLIFSLLSFSIQAAEFPAILTWADTTTLSTPLSGIVSSVKVEVGDTVKKGQLLATLDPRPYQASLKRAKAEVQRLKSRFEDAEREHQRARELFDRTVLSQTDLQTAEVAFSVAQAEFHRAEAELTLARLDIEYSQIRAPFAGLVIDRHVQPGEVVVNQLKVTPMLRLARTDRVMASAWITLPAATSLVRGKEVSVLAAGKSYTAIIRKLDASSRHKSEGAGILLQAELLGKTTTTPDSVAIIRLPEDR